jgi:hypothetical protein
LQEVRQELDQSHRYLHDVGVFAEKGDVLILNVIGGLVDGLQELLQVLLDSVAVLLGLLTEDSLLGDVGVGFGGDIGKSTNERQVSLAFVLDEVSDSSSQQPEFGRVLVDVFAFLVVKDFLCLERDLVRDIGEVLIVHSLSEIIGGGKTTA